MGSDEDFMGDLLGDEPAIEKKPKKDAYEFKNAIYKSNNRRSRSPHSRHIPSEKEFDATDEWQELLPGQRFGGQNLEFRRHHGKKYARLKQKKLMDGIEEREDFEATDEWQEVREGYRYPMGLEYKVDEHGNKFARKRQATARPFLEYPEGKAIIPKSNEMPAYLRIDSAPTPSPTGGVPLKPVPTAMSKANAPSSFFGRIGMGSPDASD